MDKKFKTARYFFKKSLRILRLTGVKDCLKARWLMLKLFFKNKKFIKKHPEFLIPPIDIAYDAFGTLDWEDIYSGGKYTAKFISDLILKYAPLSTHILEWGCGPARVLRYLPQHMPSKKIFGSDYNSKSIEWCQKFLKNIQFITNKLQPPLAYNANSFDAIYNFSIFTHLGEKSHYEWMDELKRVLKSKGILI